MRSMQRVDTVLSSLKLSGYRMSKGRKAIITTLLSVKRPITPLEVYETLKNSPSRVDKVTVYRELKFLSDLGIVHPVRLLDHVQRFEIAPETGHKHHLICTTCKTVKDVDMECADLHSIERDIGQKNQFTVRGHSLEFYGVCSQCS